MKIRKYKDKTVVTIEPKDTYPLIRQRLAAIGIDIDPGKPDLACRPFSSDWRKDERARGIVAKWLKEKTGKDLAQ